MERHSELAWLACRSKTQEFQLLPRVHCRTKTHAACCREGPKSITATPQGGEQLAGGLLRGRIADDGRNFGSIRQEERSCRFPVADGGADSDFRHRGGWRIWPSGLDLAVDRGAARAA